MIYKNESYKNIRKVIMRFYDGCDVLVAAVAHLHIVFVKQLFEMPRVEVFLDKV